MWPYHCNMPAQTCDEVSDEICRHKAFPKPKFHNKGYDINLSVKECPHLIFLRSINQISFYLPLDEEGLSVPSSEFAFCIFRVAHCGEQTAYINGQESKYLHSLSISIYEGHKKLRVIVPPKFSPVWSCRSRKCPVRIQTWKGS